VVRLMGLEDTKAVHHLYVPDAETFHYIGWSRNQTGKQVSKKASSGNKSLHDTLSGGLNGLAKDEMLNVPDLPHELAFLEVETALPKISPLPVSGGIG
jgi:anaphase-promoting complex subunit 4